MKSLDVVIASHIFASGPALFLEEYLMTRVDRLTFIGHPFMDRAEINSFYRRYIKGEKVIEHKALAWKLPDPFMRLKDAFYTMAWVLTQRKKVDLYIGSDNYLAFLGLILKKLGKVRKVVFYTIDYVSQRFKNPFLNYAYHFFDRYCLKNCDIVWNVSEKFAVAREEFDGLKRDECVSQILVPLGIWYDRIPKLSSNKKDKNTIVFMGHILGKQGLDIVLKAMPAVKKRIPSVKLKIVGKGPYESRLKTLSKKLKLKDSVSFLGYIESHEDVEAILAKSTVAVATYKPDPGSFTYFADPGKIKNYLAAGLPVFITDVPAIAKVIEKEKCGIICQYDDQDLALKIIGILTDRKKLSVYSSNATKFASGYDWNRIFAVAMRKSI